MESIGLLTGGIAHDFNNILASILGYSGLALQRFADRVPEKLVDYLKEVQIASALCATCGACLAFSRGESGERVPMKIQSCLIRPSRCCARPCRPASKSRRRSRARCREVLADPVQLQQVVLNLSINSRDAMAGTGNIAMSLRRLRIQ